MPRFLAAGLSLLTLVLALFAVPARAHAARGMELALQDDAVFVDQRWMERDTALDHAVDLRTKRIRVNVLWARTLVTGAYEPQRPGRRPGLRLLPHRRAAGRGRQARHQAPADARRSRAGVGHQGPPGRQQRAGRRQVRRVRAHRGLALRRPRRSLRDLERAELEHVARLPPSMPASLYRGLYIAGYTERQGRRPARQGAVRRAGPERRRPRDRAAEVPARRHLLATPTTRPPSAARR